MAETAPSLLERVLAGDDRNLLLLAADGLLPVPSEELLAAQVRLAGHEDEEVAGRARAALEQRDPRDVAELLAAEAPPPVVDYFASHSTHPAVLESALRRRDLPPQRLVELAERLEPDLQERLLLRQDAILEEPEILGALERNPRLSKLARRKIEEYREHLLPKPEGEGPAKEETELAVEELEAEEAEYTSAQVAAAIEEAKEVTAAGDHDEETGLSEAQIRSLPVPARLRLARGASRTLRSILVRDPNARVATAAIKHNPITEQEIERIAKSRAVVEEVLEEIAKDRSWSRKYSIVHALVQNPRTPINVAVGMVGRLSVRDLRELARNRNVPDGVRSRARSLYKMKAQ